MVLPDSDGITRVPPYSGYSLALLIFRLRDCHPTCSAFPCHSTKSLTTYRLSYNPKEQALWFGLFPFRSPLLRKSNFLSLPTGNEMFQFPASSSQTTMYS